MPDPRPNMGQLRAAVSGVPRCSNRLLCAVANGSLAHSDSREQAGFSQRRSPALPPDRPVLASMTGSRHQCKGPVNPVRPAVRSSRVPRRIPRSTAAFCRRKCRCPMCHRAAGDSGCRDVAQWRISRDVGQRRRGGARTVDGVTRCPWSELATAVTACRSVAVAGCPRSLPRTAP
jgi:hypothetical protein